MLIFPIERKPDWKHPPVFTLLIIFVNLVVYFAYQSNDADIQQRLLDNYQQSNILRYERDLYLEYLDETQNTAYLSAIKMAGNDAEQDRILLQLIPSDQRFDKLVRKHWAAYEADASALPLDSTRDLIIWRGARQMIEGMRANLSSIRFGFTPNNIKPYQIITNLFLHGSIDHIIGNMVFLFLFGFMLELVLGWKRYALLYVGAGILSNGMHFLLNMASLTPLIGASGAVSGLMGAYLALYRLQKIRFFYTLIFYFGEFKAPALLILPLWIGKELYGVFFTHTNIAYWAHIGGLLAGVGLLLLTPQKAVDKTHINTNASSAEPDPLEVKLRLVQHHINQLEFEHALAVCEKLRDQYPDALPVRKHLLNLLQNNPNDKHYHQEIVRLIQYVGQLTDANPTWKQFTAQAIETYERKATHTLALHSTSCPMLALFYLRNNDIDRCIKYVDLGLNKMSLNKMDPANAKTTSTKITAAKATANKAMLNCLKTLIKHYKHRQQEDKAIHYIAAYKHIDALASQ